MLAKQLLGLLMDFDWLVYYVECPKVSTTKYNDNTEGVILCNWGCTSIYQPLSYPFSFLNHPCFNCRKTTNTPREGENITD